MQIKHPYRKFCRLDPARAELSPQAAERFDRHAKRRCYGTRGRKPG